MKTVSQKIFGRLLAANLAVAVGVLVTGCQTVAINSTQETSGPKFSPTDPAIVEILHTEPNRPHIRLGEVRAEPSDEDVSAAKIEAALRAGAAKMGAHAAVIVYDQAQVTGAYVTGPWYGRSLERIEGRVVIAVPVRYQ
jgi:hypothetical protein